MSDLSLLSLGVAIGVATAAPVGPVNIMTLSRTLRSGFWAGLAVGLGAILADSLFAAAALFGVAAITLFVEGHEGLIRLVGGLVLIGFGVVIMRAHPHLSGAREPRGTSHLAGTATAFAMTVTNPGAVLGFLAIIGGLGDLGPDPGNHAQALVVLAGVVIGGFAWWLTLCAIVTRLRARITDAWLDHINLAAGLLLVVLGLAILGHLAIRAAGW